MNKVIYPKYSTHWPYTVAFVAVAVAVANETSLYTTGPPS